MQPVCVLVAGVQTCALPIYEGELGAGGGGFEFPGGHRGRDVGAVEPHVIGVDEAFVVDDVGVGGDEAGGHLLLEGAFVDLAAADEIGRASCRERVCQDV